MTHLTIRPGYQRRGLAYVIAHSMESRFEEKEVRSSG
jgi:hypothetical protein